MKEAIGNSFLINIVIIFLFLMMGLLISSLSYSKAYKVKNMIINTLEKNKEFDDSSRSEINDNLAKIGYRVNATKIACPKISDDDEATGVTQIYGGERGQYHYCLYKVVNDRGYYFRVISYMHYDVPLIGDKLAFSVQGETRTIYELKG